MENPAEECCPKFDPAPWDGKTIEWQEKKFIKTQVWTFLFIPLNFGSVMTRMVSLLEKAGTKTTDGLCLSEHKSPWKMDLYLAVDQDIPGAETVTLSGKYVAKVYEGNFKDTGKWSVDFSEFAKAQSLDVKKQYMWYTTCPKCAKKYGKNYVVIIGEV